ncbi:prepilin peptidase [Apilactobacillus apisilvae]|uniref:prepilin peptidase n=1 Tax=Apilactobacillus apisilvae TaxID=2923364 RepID=UPI0037BE7795
MLGSFIALAECRTNRNESIIYPRSHCDYCNYTLQWFDLIPIVSYIFLMGKCRECKRKISISFFMIEILSILINVLFYLKTNSLIYVPFILCLIFLSLQDFHKKYVSLYAIIILLVIAITINYDLFKILIIFSIYLVLTILNRYGKFIGSADIDIICICAIVFDVNTLINIVLISSSLCLIFFVYFKNKENKLPFVPFIFAGIIISICIQK